MNCFTKVKHALIAALLAVGISSTASADIVYDPWNHAENIAQLAQNIKEVQQMIQMVTQQGQILNLAQLDNLKWVIDLVNVHEQQGTLQFLMNQLGQLYDQSESAERATRGIYREYLTSDLSWEEYLAREKRITEANNGVHTATFQHATETLQGLEQQYDTIRDLNSRTDTAQGTQQLLQTLNKHMNLIATQNAQILALIAQERREESDEKAQQDEKKKKSLEAHRAAKAARERSWNSLRGAMESFRGGSAETSN